ncbi:GNAT family N-acetyltransferase [Nocardioides sp. GCM10027113]|uniref:GNAT family N-acetyltransferase n=1 Tax=unclassified Nocardioides TaxID=2615069 RepID=UPI003616ED28
MHVESLAWRTDLALLTLAGSTVEDHGNHLVVRTPDNPTFYWGNFLLLAEPPVAGAVDGWEDEFVREFPLAAHRAFGVDGAERTTADLKPLVDAGYEVDGSSVMTAQAVHPPPRPNTEAELRPLTSDDDWEQQVALALAGEGEWITPEFVVRRNEAQRALVEQGHGRWYGAFLDGRLLSSLGLLEASPGLARFQEVKTHPDARGQGLCGTLVHHASRWALDELGATTLVMVADPDYLAIRIYRSVGFRETETQLAALRSPVH